MSGNAEKARTISDMLLPEVEPGLYQIAPGTLITKEAMQDAVRRYLAQGGAGHYLTRHENHQEAR